jgi:hypothetical protein
MAPKLAAALVIVASCGCRMCSDSCDYSPPVAGSVYGGVNGRAGSAVRGVVPEGRPPAPDVEPESFPDIIPTTPAPTLP